eukprot:TRINITY_DN57740_c0_g1_i1.p1 TRINITY_DN57740_c0_g1~~TRINITY_DN57740_c0_g1_i1.p1  ORF type:complete len:155 (-),score=6.59 TRINITY_DN57740_c0_g1_i1:131-595(-)
MSENMSPDQVVVDMPPNGDNAVGRRVRPEAPEPWSSGLCGCLSEPLDSVIACYCWPCYIGQIEAMVEKDAGRTRDCDIRDCVVPFLLEFFLGGIGYGIQGIITTKHLAIPTNVKQSPLMDFLASCCCPCCFAVRARRHADAFGLPSPGCALCAK